MFIVGIGLFICTLPHYIIGKYEPPASENILCGVFIPPGFAPPPGNTTANNTLAGVLPSPCDSQAEIAERYVRVTQCCRSNFFRGGGGGGLLICTKT